MSTFGTMLKDESHVWDNMGAIFVFLPGDKLSRTFVICLFPMTTWREKTTMAFSCWSTVAVVPLTTDTDGEHLWKVQLFTTEDNESKSMSALVGPTKYK